MGVAHCLHKITFSRILETMRQLFPEHYNFYPTTWYLPHQLSDFTLDCKARAASDPRSKQYYIVKPDIGTQGEGIYLISSAQEYRICSRSHIVQEYMAKPLLIDGYKFDLRIYVVICNLDPLEVYLCNEGLARFCTQRYMKPTAANCHQSFMHLTNYSLNKRSERFDHTQQVDSGSKRTLTSVLATLQSLGIDVVNIWQGIEEMVYKTMLAIVPQLKVYYLTEMLNKSTTEPVSGRSRLPREHERPSCFQILGFDVLIMDNLKPLLLEVNSNPSLRLDCEIEIAPGISEYYISKVDVKVKKPLVLDTLKLLERRICKRFNLAMDEEEGGWEARLCDVTNKDMSQKTSMGADGEEENDKENEYDMRRRWSAESEFGPHFVEIAKRNNTVTSTSRAFGLPNTESCESDRGLSGENRAELEENKSQDCATPKSTDIQFTVSGTSPYIRKKQEKQKIDRLAKEKSWIQSNESIADDIDQREDSQMLELPTSKMRKDTFCLTQISTKAYQSIFDKLRLLEETTVIFFSSMGHRYSENMGATAFRTFGRHCKLSALGFNQAMIDLIYVEIQRRWSFLNNMDSTSGLCYQAFLEAFFRIAYARYTDMPKKVAVQNLIDHCKRAMGPEDFSWSKTLYPKQTPDSRNPSAILRDHRKLIKIAKASKQILDNSDEPKKGAQDDGKPRRIPTVAGPATTRSHQDPPDSQVQLRSKYELMKAIHQIYSRKWKSKPVSKKDEPHIGDSGDSTNSGESADNDSVHSLPQLPAPEPSNPPIISQTSSELRNPSIASPDATSASRKSIAIVMKTYSYSAPDSKTKLQPITNVIRPSYKFNRYTPLTSKQPSRSSSEDNSKRRSTNEMTSLNSDRMKKLMDIYGGSITSDFFKRVIKQTNDLSFQNNKPK